MGAGTAQSVFARAPDVARERVFLVCSVSLLAGAAWLALWFFGSSPGGFLVHHPALSHTGGVAPGLFAMLFVGGWTVMTVAMMLPTSLPLVAVFHTVARRRRDRAQLIALVIAGYLATWTVFGVVVYLGHLVLSWFAEAGPRPESYSWVVGGSIVLVAGAFQFTQLKYHCLDKCRSPLSFVMGHWRGRNNRWQALSLGIHHGLFCVGCCWALMLLMFVVSVGNLGWMLTLAAVMTIEKNVRWGRRISAPLGIALLGAGTAMLALG